MTELHPLALQAGGETPDPFRLLHADLLDSGVLGSDHLAVTEQGTPAMGVTVAAGRAVLPGTQAALQGSYYCVLAAAVNVTLAPADETNDRLDLVVARVLDSFHAGGDDEWELAVVTGTPAADPVEPSVPDNAIVLALVEVDAQASSVTNADITDGRIVRGNARGIMRFAQRLNAQVSIGDSFVFMTGMDVTVDIPADRTVRVRLKTSVHSSVADDRARMELSRDNDAIAHVESASLVTGGEIQVPMSLEYIEILSAGSYRYRGLLRRQTGSRNITSGSSGRPTLLIIEDLGPA
jgi:hypothetical protein